MSFLFGQMTHHVNGQKELTSHEEIIKLDPYLEVRTIKL